MEEMKIAKAYLRYVRIAPRKVQIVCDLIRGKDAGTAMAILMQTPKAASEPLMKLLSPPVPMPRTTSAWTRQAGGVRGVRHSRPHPEADDAPGSGPRLSDQ